MEQFTYIKDAKLGKEKNPSYWMGQPEYLPITRIKLSCGGGIGGASWYEYVYRVNEIPSNIIVKFKRYDGKEISINTAFIVKAEDFKLAIADLNISEWAAMTRDYNGSNIKRYYVK